MNKILITGRTPAKTPNGGDRFIPSRATTNFELSHYKVKRYLTILKCLYI